MSSPVYIAIRANDKPTEAIVDTGSAITIINLDFLKTMQHKQFMHKPRVCKAANSTSLDIIGQIELTIKIKHIETSIMANVATNLITSILLGNDWINANHVYLFGDQKQLTIPDQYGKSIRIPYSESQANTYSALLLNQVTLPPRSQTLVEIKSSIDNATNLIFEPHGYHHSKFIFVPHSLVNIYDKKTKVLLINVHDRQQTLSKNTRIGTISRDMTLSIFTTSNSMEAQSPMNEYHPSAPRLPRN